MDAFVIVLALAAVIMAVSLWHNRMQARRLDRLIRKRDYQALVDMGWRVEFDTATHDHIVKGRRVNHLLHLILTVLTGGLWLIVWAVLALNGGEKRRTLPK